MNASVSASSRATLPLASQRTPLDFDRIVVIGGGCYGSWYTGQLSRAHSSGALNVREVVVVDRNAECAVAERTSAGSFGALPLRLVVSSWSDYLNEWLASGAEALAHQALVPSPLMPHLLLDWLASRAIERWPSRHVRVEPLPRAPRIPWERAAPDGRHYVSFAEWLCPINCIEPVLCPATKGPRSWSMAPAVEAYVAAANQVVSGQNAPPQPLCGPVIFQCIHRTHGVGMIDADAIAAADARVAEWGASGPLAVLVGTVSHCHGALGVLAAN